MKPGSRNKLLLVGLALVLAGCKAKVPERDASADEGAIVETTEVLGPDAPGVTPMGERVAVIAVLNKRNGIVTDLEMTPGQARRVGDAILRLRACETTAPWEAETLTGAFLQLDVKRRQGEGYDRVFSGWVWAESPSLNVVEHPVFDAWPKSCTMSFPEGPEAPPARSGSASPSIAPSVGTEIPPATEGDPLAPEPAPPPPPADNA